MSFSDLEDAAEWFELAAEQGHAPAQLALAELYLNGLGVEEDRELAYFRASLAARGGEKAQPVRKKAGSRLYAAELRALNRKVNAWSPEVR